jgi:hypothetical protein
MGSNLQLTNSLGSTGQFVKDQNGKASPLTLSTEVVGVGGNGHVGRVVIDDAAGQHTIAVGGPQGAGRIDVGGHGARGQVAIFDENNNFTINIGGAQGAARIGIGGNGSVGMIEVFDVNTQQTIRLASEQGRGRLALGGNGSIGTIDVFGASSNHTIRIGSEQGPGRIGLGGNGSPGVIEVFDANTTPTIKIDGTTGDVQLLGGDCAEEFDIETGETLDPGTVMVIGPDDKLRRSTEAYDKRVAGVLSGAGDCRPGIILGRSGSHDQRLPLALTGKAYCQVDARYGAVEVGDLLTTSPTPGYAMKMGDPLRAFGAVIGKAFRPLPDGHGLIPILIALQ